MTALVEGAALEKAITSLRSFVAEAPAARPRTTSVL